MKTRVLTTLPIGGAIALSAISAIGTASYFRRYSAIAGVVSSSDMYGWVVGAIMLFASACYLHWGQRIPTHLKVLIWAWVSALSVYPLFWWYYFPSAGQNDRGQLKYFLDSAVMGRYCVIFLILTASLLLAVFSHLKVPLAMAICRLLRRLFLPPPPAASGLTT